MTIRLDKLFAEEPKEYAIEIPNWHPHPLNKLINCHWSEMGRHKHADMLMLSTCAHKAKVPKATGKRSLRIIITLGKGQRGCDPDAYFKSTCDALVRTGYLKQDSRQWLELLPVAFQRGTKATTIVLRDIL